MKTDDKVNILLVDDRPEGLLAMEAVLDDPGYNLVRAQSGYEAIAQLLGREFAVVLLDVQMPGMDGFQTAMAIRDNEKIRDVPVIFITAISKEERYVLKGYDVGAVDYLVKPFDPHTLKSKVAVFVRLFKKNAQIKTQAEELQRLAQELHAMNQELEAFSYSVSHDLRAPLRSIDGFSQVLAEDLGDKLDAQGHDYFQRIRAASQKMSELIDDLLSLSRLSRRKMRWEEVDLSRMAEDIVAELRRAHPPRDMKVLIEPGLTAQGDGNLLQIALQNLLHNAWKFTGQKEGATVEFGRMSEAPEPVYFVRDNGVGFDMTFVSKLFGAFQRLHDAREFPGTGVGLAIVQRVMRRHGGRCWAESALDQGATFFFSVPAVDPDGAGAREEASRSVLLAPARPL